MSQPLITQLTPEQEALIPVYRDKWRAIALSTERIDSQKAVAAVKVAYAAIGCQEPEIYFCDSPYAALRELLSLQSNLLESQLWKLLESQLRGQLWERLASQLGKQLFSQLGIKLGWQLHILLENQLERPLDRQLYSQLENHIESLLERHSESLLRLLKHNYRSTQRIREIETFEGILPMLPIREIFEGIRPEVWTSSSSWFDFSISVLNCEHDHNKWEAIKSLITHCGWIFPFEGACFVCDRPIKLSFDSKNFLHAEGEPAIQFSDGYSIYAHHGVVTSEKYGKLPPHQWSSKWYLKESNTQLRLLLLRVLPTHQWCSQWLLSETNAELKRELIQGIGYARICQELQATNLDSWQEYALLRIDQVDVEPIYLLKMTCPSTGYIHALRVPPSMKSAREAIRWVNWGIDPEEFCDQT